jgi:glycosyltransferase involved in cell wall biosynthesis
VDFTPFGRRPSRAAVRFFARASPVVLSAHPCPVASTEDPDLRLAYLSIGRHIHTERWLRFFVERGHDVHLLTVQPGPIPGVTVHDITTTLGPKPARYAASLVRVRSLLGRLDPDVLHTHFLTGFGYWGWLSGFRPFLLTVWGDDVYQTPFESPAKLWLARRALAAADWISGDSVDMLAKAVVLGARRERCEHLQLGVDFRQFRPDVPDAAREAMRARYATPPTAPVVLSTRSFSQAYYNIPLFVDAIPELSRRHPDAVFWIAGYEGEDGAIRRQVEARGVARVVRFLGRVPHDELQDVVAAADVYITIPSLDATAVSLLEAMAAGKAIVASALPSAAEWIVDGVTGRTVPPGEGAPLVEAISSLLADPAARARLGRAAHDVARARADWHQHMGRNEEIYVAAARAHRTGGRFDIPSPRAWS